MIDEPEILPPTPRPRSEVRSVEDGYRVSILSPLIERHRRKSVEERNRFLSEVRRLIEIKTDINRSIVDYEKSVVALRDIDRIRESERIVTRAEREKSELDAIEGLEVKKLKWLLERLEVEEKVHDTQERLNRKKNPPQREPQPDSRMEALRDTFSGGGKYTREAKALRERLIRERGGERNLTEEDRDTIENALRMAAEFDHGKGHR